MYIDGFDDDWSHGTCDSGGQSIDQLCTVIVVRPLQHQSQQDKNSDRRDVNKRSLQERWTDKTQRERMKLHENECTKHIWKGELDNYHHYPHTSLAFYTKLFHTQKNEVGFYVLRQTVLNRIRDLR